jgi:beta-galactosidase
MKRNTLILLALLASAGTVGAAGREETLLSGAGWQFLDAESDRQLPKVMTREFDAASWKPVAVPHVFQTREHLSEPTQGWYRREFAVPREQSGKRLYLVFEGAATIADVYVNGKHLGQHRGAYTRFVFDATDAVKIGGHNQLAVRVDNNPENTADCLPDRSRLYQVWGGLYRKVWLVATDPLHVDLQDYASPGVYVSPQKVTAQSADMKVKTLVRNSLATKQEAEVRATLLDPDGSVVNVFAEHREIPAGESIAIEFSGVVKRPKLWSPDSPSLYHVKAEVLRDGKVVDTVTQPTGFRDLVFETATGRVKLNGKPIILVGGNLHQEIEAKASAMSDEDFKSNYEATKDMGLNWIRLAHYPHAQLEYDLCDRLGIFCWAENGHSNPSDNPGATANQITTEMVKQNYNHPSIAVWSVANEAAGKDLAEQLVPLVKALDLSRPVVTAKTKCTNADFVAINAYTGWYSRKPDEDVWGWPLRQKNGYISETGAGGVTTTHCDYSAASHKVNFYEPEEYQQLVAEARCQTFIADNDGTFGMFSWWCLRDFTNGKYKRPGGWNTKGLLTYAGFKKDIYYLFRCFQNPKEPTVHITSKCYFLRAGAVDNGIKTYSSAPQLTLTLNGKEISTLKNGEYAHKNGRRVDHVFFWRTPLHTGKNIVKVSDGAGHEDSATIYFQGANGLPELPGNPLVTELQTSNPANRAYFMDMPVQAQWPIYYDLDSTADNSFDSLPTEIAGAKWIALRRVTKNGQATDLSFKLVRPATVFVMATAAKTDPAFLTNAGFKPVDTSPLVWRDNDLMLVSAQLYSRQAVASEVIHLSAPDRDAIVLLKE